MKITQEQINSLYTFTRQHYVEYYDLQTELVDHLANDIETIWVDQPNLSFEMARDQSFKKFGVFGFMDVVEEKTNALNKYYWKLVWREFVTFFKLPKIIMTLFLIWMFYYIISAVEEKEFILIPLALLIVVIPLIYSYRAYKKTKKRKQLTGKKWLMDSILMQLGGIFYIINCVIQFIIPFQNNKQLSPFYILIFSIIIVSLGIALFVSIKIVTPNLQEKLVKEQPDYLLM